MSQRGIYLGYPFDNLLNRQGVGPSDSPNGSPCGILLPDGDSDIPWTGNIVICGKAGSGKSTLALQIALAATHDPNGFATGYISLEEGTDGIRRKAWGLNWGDDLKEARHLYSVDDAAPEKELERVLSGIIATKTECPVNTSTKKKPSPGPCPTASPVGSGGFERKVWLFSLSPASLVRQREQGSLFQERYNQLERLLSAASALNRNGWDRDNTDPSPVLPLVCVDSLNVFGSTEPVREEYHRLFDLFHRHNIVGVFTVEAGGDTPFDSTMADVVIRLTSGEDQGYVVQYIEVEKSRYIQQNPGRHTFKILPPQKPASGDTEEQCRHRDQGGPRE